MRFYYYVEPNMDAEIGPGYDLHIKSEDDIIREYGPFWLGKMTDLGRHALITKENLVLDWVSVNWAVELV